MVVSLSRAGAALVLALLLAHTGTQAAAAEEKPGNGLLGGGGLLESFSLSADRGPVEIEAKTLEFEYKTGRLTYQGQVTVSQGDIKLTSDRLVVTLDTEEMGRPRQVVASGNVRIQQGEREATGGVAEFDQAQQTITLSDEAVLRDGANEVSGDRVVVYIDEQRSVVEGGDHRVRARLFPSGKPSKGEASTTAARAVEVLNDEQ